MAKSSEDGFMGLFWKLSDPSDTVRVTASEQIVDALVQCQQKHNKSKTEEDLWCSEIKYSLSRLFQGLASERKASRLGYSLAVTHLMARLDINDDSRIGKVLSLADEKLSSSKEVEKAALIGKVFAYLSVIKSCSFDSAKSSLKAVFKGLMKLSKSKSYLRPSCLHGISELVTKVPNSVFDEIMWPELSGIFAKGWDECDADVFCLLQVCCKHQSETCGKTFLKAHNWIAQKSKKIELIGLHSYKHIGQMLPGTTACHPHVHPLCYEIVGSVAKCDKDVFSKFWKEMIETGLIDSTPERKYLGLKLSLHITSDLNVSQIRTVWSSKAVTGLMHIFANKSNPLHAACKSEILEGIGEKTKASSSEQQLTLLYQFLTSPAGLFLDDNTNTRCIATIAGSLNLEALKKYVEWLKRVFVDGKLNREGVKEVTEDTARRWSVCQMRQLLRDGRLPRSDEWILPAVQFLFALNHFSLKGRVKKILGFSSVNGPISEISGKTRADLRKCLDSSLNGLNSMSPGDGKAKREFQGTACDGEFWTCKLIEFSDSLMNEDGANLVSPMDKKTKAVWSVLTERLSQLKSIQNSDSSRVTELSALRLLLSHVGIRLLNCPKDELVTTKEVLADLFGVVKSRLSDDRDKAEEDEEEMSWVEVVIETILSMLSQNSKAIRSVADQVFKLFRTQLTGKGLRLILDVLDPERGVEILEGDESVDEEGSDEEADDDDDDGDGESGEDEDLESDDSAFDEVDVSDDAPEDNMLFRNQVKDALGEAAAESSDENDNVDAKEAQEDSDEEDSGPELDDDAMMRIDSVLADVFRQKMLSKKKTEQDSRRQLLTFQLRVLDLIEIMVTDGRQGESAADSLILEAVKPLLVAVQHASRNAADMTLAEKAAVLLRVKICKMKNYPRTLSEATIKRCHDDIEGMVSVAHQAHSVFICQLASDCSLFLLRVLAGNRSSDRGEDNLGAVDVKRMSKIYREATESFMTERDSRVQACVIQDYITRFPSIAASLAPDLLKYAKDAVLIYRRTKACEMLQDLLKNAASKEKCQGLLFQIVSVANELIERATGVEKLKAKYYVELLKLYHVALKLLLSSDKLESLNKPDLVAALEKYSESSRISKSQELTSYTWKVLTLFGVERGKKKRRKRTKSDSDGEASLSPAPKKPDEGSDETPRETKKQLKARVLMEKKERRRKKTIDISNENSEKNDDGCNEAKVSADDKKKRKKKAPKESEKKDKSDKKHKKKRKMKSENVDG